MRRIVTGHNEEGKSVITIDGPPARSIGEDVGGLFELWNTAGQDIISSDVIDRADYISKRFGGDGAVREICDLIIRNKGSSPDVAFKHYVDKV